MKPISYRQAFVRRGLFLLLGCYYCQELPAIAADREVILAVTVKDDSGKAIPTAHVIVYQERRRGSTLYVRPPDYSGDTNANGVLRLTVRVPAGDELNLSIEVSAENFVGTKEDMNLGTDFPARVLKQFFLEAKKLTEDKPGEKTTTTIKVHVIRKDTGAGVPSASVSVLSFGGFLTQTYTGGTDANGDAAIVVPLNNDFEVRVSKELLGETKKKVGGKDYLKEIGPVELVLEKQVGAQVKIHVKDAERNNGIGDASVSLSGPGYYSATTDGDGNATMFVAEDGSFDARIAQDYYETKNERVRLEPGEETKAFEFELKAKPKKQEEGPNTIEVTVLQGDKTDRIGGFNLALPDASVKAGSLTQPTDSSGVAKITGDFQGDIPVTVTASGYKSQSKTVRITGLGRFTGGNGAVTFLMQSESAEDFIEASVSGKSGPMAGVTVTANGESGTTDANGKTRLKGKFEGAVEVAAEKNGYLRQTKNINVSGGKGSVSFTLQTTPDEDSVSITVMGSDPDGGSPSAIAGAVVSANGLTATTDKGGHATITGQFKDTVDVGVEAKGFVSQTQPVPITKPARTGAASFTLKPEGQPLQLVVEVRDASAANNPPIQGATVYVGLPGNATGSHSLEWVLEMEDTNSAGEAKFTLKSGPRASLEKLRAGVQVQARKDTYKEKPADSIPTDFLQPAKEARRYTVELEKDWSELIKALGQIEGRVGALRNEVRSQVTKSQAVKLAAAKSIAARGRVEAWLNELKAARKAFDTKLSGTKCEQAKELVKSIEALQKEGSEKETQLRKLLDEASGIVANCKTKAEGAVVAEKYRNALELAHTMRGLEPKASQANDKLKRFAEAMKDAGPLQTKLQETATNIQNELETAKKDSSTAMSDFNDAYSTHLNLPGKRAALASDYEKVKTNAKLTKNYDNVPKDIAARLERLDQVLGEGGADMSLTPGGPPDLSRVDEVIKPALAQIEKSKAEADTIAADFKGAMCTVQPMDSVVEELGALDTGNTIELASVADLPARAQACGVSASPTPTPIATPTPTPTPKASPSPSATPTPTPTPSDEVVVPDVSGYKDPKAMKAAAGPDMVGKIIGVKDKPPDGQTTPFKNQLPQAGKKAARNSTLQIFVYQSMLQAATPTPSPTATPARRTKPPGLIGLTLEQAVSQLPSNMRIQSDEVGDAPPSPELAFTIFYQNPPPTMDVDAIGPVVISVRRYGSAKSTVTGAARFDGSYTGSYQGADHGRVRFVVAGGTITITSPGSGTGTVSADGSASISGAGRDGNSSYSFSGKFIIGADGNATAGGRWSGQQSGYQGSGTWSASR